MKKIILTLTLISSLIAEGISGVSYFRYAIGDFNEGEQSGFHIDRAYLTYNKTISDKSAFKFQSDIHNMGGAYHMFIKKAHMTYKMNENSKIMMGVIGMNMLNIQEKNWGYRFIQKSAMDLNKWSATADLGVGFHQSLGKISLSVLLTNGEGYKKTSSDDYEKLSIQAIYGEKRLDKNDGFNAGVVFSSLDYDIDDESKTGNVMGFFSGWSGMGARLGFEYNMGTDLNLEVIEDDEGAADIDETTMYDTSSSLMSFYGNYTLPFLNDLSLFARYDMLDSGIENHETTTLLAGLVYKCEGGVMISPNVKQVTVGEEDPTTSMNVTLQLSF